MSRPSPAPTRGAGTRRAAPALALLGTLLLGAVALGASPWTVEKLSPAARQVVHERMRDHGTIMGALVWDVILLDYARAERSATALGKGARPLDRNAPELEHHVYFFTLQDELYKGSLALADAARARDGKAFATAFKGISETCVHCHAVYMDPAASEPPRRPVAPSR